MRIDTQGPTAHNDVVRMYTQRVATERRDKEGVSLPGDKNRTETPEYRVGFGDDTISTGAAALLAINRNLRAAREVIPTAEEALNQVRARFERLDEAPDTTNPESTEIAAPAPQTNTTEERSRNVDSQSPADNTSPPIPAWPLRQHLEGPDTGTQIDLSA